MSIVGTPSNFSGQSTTYTAETGSDRYVVITTSSRQSSGSNKITSVDFGGQAATPAVENIFYSGVSTQTQIWYIKEADIPSGSQALSFSSTGSPTWSDVGATVLTIENHAQTIGATDLDGNTADVAALSATVATTSGGLIIGAGMASTSTQGFTVSGGAANAAISGSDRAVGSERAIATYDTADSASETLTLRNDYQNSSNTQNYSIAVFPALSGASITNIDGDNDVRAGQTGVTINGTGFGTVSAVTLGGETLTLNSNTATTVDVDIPDGIDLKWGRTDLQLSVTDGSGSYTLDNVTLSPETGWSTVEVTALPDFPTTASFAEEAVTDLSFTAVATDVLAYTDSADMTVDGLTVPVIDPPATKTGTYKFWDESGSTWTAESSYTWTDGGLPAIGDMPVITLSGDNPYTLETGTTWTDPGYTATDTEDGDITNDVIVAGDAVDTNTIGTYIITYDVADSDGNAAVQKTRTVNVVAAIVPVLSSPTGTKVGAVSASGTVTTDEGNGILHYVASENPSETAATIKAGSNNQPVTVAGVQNVSISGLTGGTTYYLHYVQDDSDSNESNVVSSASFTTDVATGGGFSSYKEWMESLPSASWTTKLRVFLESKGYSGSTTRMLYEYLKTVSSKSSHQERKKDWKDGGWN